MEFANPLNTTDVLNDFDFDTFLHDHPGDDGTALDYLHPFGEISAE